MTPTNLLIIKNGCILNEIIAIVLSFFTLILNQNQKKKNKKTFIMLLCHSCRVFFHSLFKKQKIKIKFYVNC